MNLKPLGDNLIVKPQKEEEKNSGIVVPEEGKDKMPEKGEVVAVGPGRVLENGNRLPMNVKVGDKIMFKKYTTEEVKIDGEEYLVVAESNVVAVVE